MEAMKKRSSRSLLANAGCALAIAATLPATVSAEVSDADFNALKETVRKLAEQVQRLEKTHETDVQTHQQDADKIQKLQQQLGDTQKQIGDARQVAEDAGKKAEAAQTQSVQTLRQNPTDTGVVNRNFMMLGDAEFQYAKTTGQNGSFLAADFAPIFVYRGNDRILFEAGFDFMLQNNPQAVGGGGSTTTLNLSFAQLDYVVNDYMTLVAGNMLLPLGTYSERVAGWLNKIPDDPLGRDLLPGSGVGAQLRGALPIGEHGQYLNYAVWGVNGPSSADGTGSATSLDLGGNVGLRSDNAVANLHGSPSGGARIGYFLPYKPHYDLEIGVSGQTGEWDNAGTHLWNALVFDATLHLGPWFETRAEFINTWYGSDDAGNVHPNGWWVQAGYKLAGLNLNLPVVSNLELVSRYDTIYDGLGTRTHRYTAGFIYFFTNALLLEGDYEFIRGNDPGRQGNEFLLQLSYGF
jgi:hypothetical protein